MIDNVQQFFQLIKDNSNPLPYGCYQSGLMRLSDEINRQGKESQAFKTITNFFSDISERIIELSAKDYSSLMFFISMTKIDDLKTFESFLTKTSLVKGLDVKTQALFLKLLFTINNNGISRLLLNEFINLKTELPLFWADMYFEIDLTVALNTLSEANLTFEIISKLLDKWISTLNENDYISVARKQTILKFKSTFNFNSTHKIVGSIENEKFFGNEIDPSLKEDYGNNETISSFTRKLVKTYVYSN